MKTLVINKWIEPYKLLETIKMYYKYTDYTFDGQNKQIKKEKFLKDFEESQYSIGLYMKNVNKFYLFTRDEFLDIAQKLIEVFEFSESDYIYEEDEDKPFELVDLGKAEATVFVKKQ